MFKRIKWVVWCSLLILSAAAASESDDGLSVFRSLDGEPARLEDYTGNGKWLVVMIWASDCHICNQEAAAYAHFYETQREKGVGVLGISMDGDERKPAALTFVERHALPFPNLIADPGMISLYYASITQEPLRGTPTFLVYDPEGKLAAAQAGAVSPQAIEKFIARKNATRTTGSKTTPS